MTARIFLFVSIFFLLACGEAEKKALVEKKPGVPIRTARVQREAGMLEVAGTVRAADVAELASRFGGFVRSVEARAGERVNRGDLLIFLDARSLQAQADKSQAAEQEVGQSIEESRQYLQAAESQKQLAANTFQRISALYEKKSASKQEYEEAESRNTAAETAWKAAKERLAQAESKLKQAKSDSEDISASLSYQRILAPFDGVIVSVKADKGTFVNPGQTLVTVENPAKYQLVFSVEQELLQSVSGSVSVVVPAVSEKQLPSRITEVSSTADPITRTYQIKADLPLDKAMRTGLTGSAFLKLPLQGSLWIESEFLNQKSDVETVMVRQGGEWRRVLVKSGTRRDGKVEILSGLNEGEEVGIFGE